MLSSWFAPAISTTVLERSSHDDFSSGISEVPSIASPTKPASFATGIKPLIVPASFAA